VAARFFVDSVKSGDSVALSCGETILYVLEELPYQQKLQIAINQLSIEGDPRKIHQAPATLVGLLRSKCSQQCDVVGLQLPPMDMVPSASLFRQELAESQFLRELKQKAMVSGYVFLGVGSAQSDSTSFWDMAQTATANRFGRYLTDLRIVGEMNNQPFDQSGKNCTSSIPGFANHVINVLSLDDIRGMAMKPQKHKVVIVATGPTKTEAVRVALKTGLANALITGADDADRLLAD
jgi:DNA-binding transcriptional regulator LsrR (DeoR family)